MIEHSIQTEASCPLNTYLKRAFPAVSFVQWQMFMRKGFVRLNGKKTKGKELVHSGDTLRIPPFLNMAEGASTTPVLSAKEAEWIRSLTLFENDDFFVINKPSGIAVQGGSKTSKHLDGYLKALYPTNSPKIVHRLDKSTSGLILFAKNLETAQNLTKLFEERKIIKTYLAVCEGAPKKDVGTITTYIAKQACPGGERMMCVAKDGAEAITNYKVMHKTSTHSLIQYSPKTGRTHQLRVHSQYLGCPIVGDIKYGACEKGQKLHLHAHKIHFMLKNEEFSFETDMPDYMNLKILRSPII